MEESQVAWWEEECEAIYKLLQKFSLVMAFFAIVVWPLFVFLGASEYFSDTLKLSSIMNIIWAPVIWFSYNHKSSYKALLSIVYSEYLNILSVSLSHNDLKDEKLILLLLTFLVCLIFQFSMLKHIVAFNVMVIKYLYMWYIHEQMFKSSENVWYRHSSYLIAMAVIILNLLSLYWRNVSFERFLYRSELEHSKNRLNIITESFSDGILIISQRMKIEFYNLCVLQKLRSAPDTLLAMISSIVFCEKKKVSNFTSSNFLVDEISYLLSSTHNEEITLGLTSGNLEWKALHMIWENNPALFITIRDVTDSVELEKKAACDQMKTLLLRSVSHELRTPLNSLIHFTNKLLQSSHILNAEDIKQLKIISISSTLMLSLINDLLDYSKILTGVFSIHKTQCNLKELIKSSCSLFEYQAAKKNLYISFRIDKDLPDMIFTDSLRISQIILNLLRNAFKFTQEGKIEVICLKTAKNTMKCCVEDTGSGVSLEEIRKMIKEIDPLNIPNLGPRGHGFGLYISNLLINQLDGNSIKVKCNSGKGSIFYFNINIYEDKPLSLSIENTETCTNERILPITISSYAHSKGFKKDILIVDDLEFNLEVLGSTLKSYDFEYDEANNGRIAVEKIIRKDASDWPYKVVVMDCEMPEMTGWEASSYIDQQYRQGKIQHLPYIIGYSAYCSEEDIKLCYQCGMIDFLPKPCSTEKIIEAIKKFI